MNEYLFYTFEGFTKSPTHKIVENLQILGFENGKTSQDAKENLLKKNSWIFESGFSQEKILYKQIISKFNLESIKIIVDYLWNDEQRHYQECDRTDRANHIFKTLKKLKKILSEN